ncbi:MAG: rod shape-determining protein MreD [Sphingobacteriia bacterium]|nr:rod shape-determining protein MreD [Sphingobacteriia bacterium]
MSSNIQVYRFRIRYIFYFISIFLLLLSQTLWVTDLKKILPSILSILIFQISLFFPRAIPSLYLLIYGLVEDAIYGNLLGTSSITYLIIMHLVIHHKRRFFTFNFLFTWLGFAICILITTLFNLLIFLGVQKKAVNLEAITISQFATLFIFPMFFYIFDKIIHSENR